MKKILDFVLVFLIVFFVFNFFNNKDKETITTWQIIFKTTDNSYAIPAWVWLEIENDTNEEITFNTCNDILLRDSAWDKVVFTDSFCKDITLNSKESQTIDYSWEYERFEKVWNYNFELSLWEKRLTSQFEVDHRWTIWKLFVWLVYAPIYNLMAFLLDAFAYSLWWSIIAITIIIRLILVWPQHKMMLSQKKLQAIQPKIKEIQKKYKGKQQELWMKMMELYKKEKVNPMWSCGFLLIQMPILLVMYRIILNIKDPSNAFYVYDYLANFSILNISYDFFGIDLLWQWWLVWLALALFIWIIQFIQVKLSLNFNKKWELKHTEGVVLEKKKWEDGYSSMMPDPDTMNKFMLYGMPIMVWVFTYTFFAWVWFYWWMSTIFTILQQLVVNKITKKSR